MKFKLLLFTLSLTISSFVFAQLGMGLKQDAGNAGQFKVKAPAGRGYGATLPASYSMKLYTPFVKSQGMYGTCAAWSAAYSAYTTQYAMQMGLTDRNLITALSFCPYYVYNKANGDQDCNAGTSLETILSFMIDNGVKRFYLPVIGCGTAITPAMDEDASRYHITEAYYLYNAWKAPVDNSAGAVRDFLLSKEKPNITDIKSAIADGYPVIYGGYVPGSFMQVAGTSYWGPTDAEADDPGQAVIDNTGMHRQHAMCIVGYDDNKYGGAFEIINSWSELWGDNGYVWIRYDDWAMFNYCAFYMDIGTSNPELLVTSGCASGDCQNGYGVTKFTNGERYEGHYKNGLRNGYGIYTWPGGIAYAGEWVDDKRNGEAIVYLSNGNYGTCTYANDQQATGFGDWVYNNGDKYTGSLSANYIRNGYGVYTFSDGRVYSGLHEGDKFSGLGKMKWTNGDQYVGEWSDNDMHGYGVYVFANGTVKAGNWSYGVLKTGQNYGYAKTGSKITSNNLDLFQSLNFATSDCQSGDCLNGKGSKKYSSGLLYEGEFKDALEDGYGTMVFTDGSKQSGYFEQGKPNGLYKVTFPSGDILIGDCINGKPDGYAIYVFASGNIVVEYYIDGIYIRDAIAAGDASGFQPVPNQFGSSPKTTAVVSKSK